MNFFYDELNEQAQINASIGIDYESNPDESEFIYGKLNKELEKDVYNGSITETATTSVDHSTNEIKVNVNTDKISTIDYVKQAVEQEKLAREKADEDLKHQILDDIQDLTDLIQRVKTLDKNKLDKQIYGDNTLRAYVVRKDEQTTVPISDNVTPTAIVAYGSDGQIQVPKNPIKEVDATSKSYVDSLDSSLTNKLEEESAVRLQKDNELQASLDNEKTLREKEDSAIRQTLSNEIDRVEQLLQNEIDRSVEQDELLLENLNNETTNRIEAVKSLQENLNTEASLRAEKDTELLNKINKEIEDRSAADTALQQNIDSETLARDTKDKELNASITKEIEDRTLADTKLQENIDKKLDIEKANVVITKDTSISYSGDSVNLDNSYINLSNSTETSKSTLIQLANDTTAGLMSTSDVATLRNLQSRVSNLEGKTTRVLYTAKTNPTASDIQSFVDTLKTDTSETEFTAPYEGLTIVVDETFHIWRYYENDNIGWRDDGVDSVHIFTNEQAGIIKGSQTDGKIYAESDGVGAVYGWDDLKTRTTNVENTLPTKVDKTSTAYQVYGTDYQGNQKTYRINTANEATVNSIPIRADNGAILINDESLIEGGSGSIQDGLQATNKNFVVSGLNTKVDKFDGSQETGDYRFTVYGQSLGEQKNIPYSSSAKEFAIAQYTSGGNLIVAAPRNDSHATTKKYVDDADATKVSQVEYSTSQTFADGSDGGVIGRAYMRFRDNTENSIVLNCQNVKYTVPVRDSTGNFYVGNPTQLWHTTNKKYVDEAIETNGGKINTISVNGTNVDIDENKNVNLELNASTVGTYSSTELDGKFNLKADKTEIPTTVASLTDASEYVKFTDYAGNSVKGVVDVRAAFGMQTDEWGRIQVVKATDDEIKAKTNEYHPLVSKNVDLIVKTGLTTNALTWSEDEKTAARNLIGAGTINDISSKVDIIEGTGVYFQNNGTTTLKAIGQNVPGSGQIVSWTTNKTIKTADPIADDDVTNKKYVDGINTNLNTSINTINEKLATIEDNAELNVQSDWNVTDTTSDAYILNKPTALSQFTNDSEFITNTVNNLTNYYLKTETYTKEEVNSIISGISTFNAEIVTTLPTENISTTTIYLIAKIDTEESDYYDEYMYISNNWEMIGSTKVDLSGIDLSNKVDKSITTTLDSGSKVSAFYSVDSTTGATKITNVVGETDIPDDITGNTAVTGSAIRMDTESANISYININNGNIYNSGISSTADGVQSMVMKQSSDGSISQNAVMLGEDQLILQLYRPSANGTNAANIVLNDSSIQIGHQITDSKNNTTASTISLSGGKALYNDNEIATLNDITNAFNNITDSNGSATTISEVATKATTAVQPEDVATTTDIDNLFV